ncbi:MAG: PocR ligand-binding domain-containing protein [Spirochaetaceae bacterium]|jgi:PAS domain S-box-containing protein|nr:PocR ligand-binding domain-containing protein [Spirochaetaceae bacterium]
MKELTDENFSLEDLIDIKELKSLMEDLYGITHFLSAIAILDISGKVLIAEGWQDICTRFHRCNLETQKNCNESDIHLSESVPFGTFKSYKCLNNLWDMVTPIEVDGRHLGNIFIGQFFYDDELPDYDLFRKQAKKYEFDEDEYLAALDRVPRLSRQTVEKAMSFYSRLAGIIASQGYNSLILSRTIKEQEEFTQKLQEKDEDFKESQRIAKVGSWRLDTATDFVTWSEELYRMYGFDPSLPPPPYSEHHKIFTSESWEKLKKALSETVDTGIPYELELETVRSDGSKGWMWVVGEVLLNENGSTKGLRGAAQDISQRKKAEFDLSRSEERYRGLINNLEAGIVVHGPDSSIILSNSRASELLGLSLEQMKGKEAKDPEWKFVSKDNLPLLLEEYPVSRIIKKKKPISNQVLGITHPRPGKLEWVNVNGFPLLDEKGEIIEIVISFTDISRRKEAEIALKKSQSKLSALFETMTEMVVLHELVFNEKGETVDYKITDCNKAFTDITGITKENALGKLASDLYQTETAPYLDVYSQVAITRESITYTTYFPPLNKHFSISVVSPEKNHFATITTDITAIQLVQKDLRDKNKELENFLYVSSHDLRTPLLNIQGFSQRLQKHVHSFKEIVNKYSLNSDSNKDLELLLEKSIPETLNYIFTNVSKMDFLINSLLEISRTGRIKMFIKKVDMNKLMKKIVSALNFQISQLSAQVVIDQLPDCYGDENLLNQLFTNIIVNALKYRNIENSLLIQISAVTENSRIIYLVKDNGIGIDSKYLEKIWNVFYRVDPKISEPGDGIGLSLARVITGKHKGNIRVESEKGKGSLFYIELQNYNFVELRDDNNESL